MSTCRIRRLGHYEGLCFCISSCAEKKRDFARNVTIKVSSNLHIICLWVPSMCGENIKTNRGSSSDKIRINEYMSDQKARSLRRAVLLHHQLCPEKKGTLLKL